MSYIKSVEERKVEKLYNEELRSKAEYENFRRNHANNADLQQSNYSTFYESGRKTAVLNPLNLYEEKMQKGANISVLMTQDKALRAAKQTDKIRQVQEEHETKEKEKMEKVLGDYVQRRLKAEEKIQKLIKENQERVDIE